MPPNGLPTPEGGLTATRRPGDAVTRGGRQTRADREMAKVSREWLRTSTNVKSALYDALNSPDWRQAVLTVLSDPDHKHFVAMSQLALERLLGRPTQAIEVSGPAGAAIKFEQLEILLPQLDARRPPPVVVPPAMLPDYAWAPEVGDDEEAA